MSGRSLERFLLPFSIFFFIFILYSDTSDILILSFLSQIWKWWYIVSKLTSFVFFFLPRKRPFFLPKKWPKLEFPISFWLLKVLLQLSFVWKPKCLCWPFPWGKAAAARRFVHWHISQKLVSPSRPWGHLPGCVCAPAWTSASAVARFQTCLTSRSCRHKFRCVYV